MGKNRSRHQIAEAGAYRWKFFRSGGVEQVVLDTGDDIAALPTLDLKLWMALAVPMTSVAFDERTASFIDTDHDGRIRPEEALVAVAWAKEAFKNLGDLIPGSDEVAFSSIRDAGLLASAQSLTTNIGKTGASSVTLADVQAYDAVYADALFNGDGIVPPESAGDADTRAAMVDILKATGGVVDRGGKPGLDSATLASFFSDAARVLLWRASADAEPGILPFDMERSEKAAAATRAVSAKIDDFFTRCRIAAFDPRSRTALSRDEADYRAIASLTLNPDSAELAAFPLAPIAPGAKLPLVDGCNPAWSGRIADFAEFAVAPLVGSGIVSIGEAEWKTIRASLGPYEAWLSSRPETPVTSLGLARVAELVSGGYEERIKALIEKDAALAPENAKISAVEKLVRFKRDLYTLLTNFVNFSAFYHHSNAIFQMGTLYLDSRACRLCLAVADEGRHASLAGLSGAFLAYCDLSRPGGQKKRIVAAFTDGDSDSLIVGRNGVFYGRDGLEWDATITRMVQNPISVRQGFWQPYKKLARMLEEQIAKRAQAGEESSQARLSATASVIATADQKGKETAAALPVKKLDLGTIALIGTAVGGVSALVSGLLQSLFGLGIWLPVGMVAIVLLISGPSMLLASLKLKKRNLGPILDANGWAINAKARVNIPFGTAMTDLAALPAGSIPALADPFAEKKKPWKAYFITAFIVALIVGGLAATWRYGWADSILPEAMRYSEPSK